MASPERNRREALIYHAKPKPGKIKIVPTKRYSSQRDLSLAYSPGVAEPCKEIAANPDDVYRYTTKGNLVAVISNGTAVLGLGNIGPLASKPVMEGKGLLFKIFADLDVFDIEVDANDPEAFIETVKRIAPTFGGINLEDIKAPEAFEIERRLKAELDIPVMHDDQHGTAIISGAALLNALELANKKIDEVCIVVSGAGSAAVSCVNMYLSLGVKLSNVWMFDIDGLITTDRTGLSREQMRFARDPKQIRSMAAAMEGADMFLGLSAPNIVSQDMLRSMAPDPIVFAMANPDPEIRYDMAMEARKDIIMATGRSDFPNQVNNVLGFPFIFRGALDVRATEINEAMKLAAVHALAALAKESVPEQVNIAYGETKLNFGRDYILPKPFDPRLISTLPPAVARAAMETGVAKEPIEDWIRYEAELLDRMNADNKMVRLLLNRARTNPKRLVYAEADQLDVLKAAQIVYDEGIAHPILLGREQRIRELMAEIEFEGNVMIIDPKAESQSERMDQYAAALWARRRRKGMTEYDAKRLVRERNYFASLMVEMGDADCMITGQSRTYPSSIRPILEIIDRGRDINHVATTNMMITDRGPMFISDTSINIDPTAETLAEIAMMTARTVRLFGIEPVVAMISYTNFGDGKHPESSKVKQAVEIIHSQAPELLIDGEIQVDFALNQDMLTDKFPFSKLAGRKVNTLIFPNLTAANATYKLMKELNKYDSIGPIIMGLDKPVHVIQFGASVEEMVNMSAVSVVDAQQKQRYDEKMAQIQGF